jgi:protein-tyrosine phosphatase
VGLPPGYMRVGAPPIRLGTPPDPVICGREAHPARLEAIAWVAVSFRRADGKNHAVTHIALRGALNVRDLGGTVTEAGRKIIPGRILRSDALCKLTAEDVSVLAGLGLHTAIDFRSAGEVASAGADLLPPGAAAVALPVNAGNLDEYIAVMTSGDLTRQRELLGDGKGVQFMIGINRSFVSDPGHRAQFGRALHLIADQGRQPARDHCTAGKDRTGWMTAIVLTALGVARTEITADYLASNDYVWAAYRAPIQALAGAGQLAEPDLVTPLLRQDPAYLDAAFAEVDAQYGSFGAFLGDGLGFGADDLTRLRDALLE